MAQRGVAGTAPLVPLLLITALGLCRGQQSTVAEEREGTCDLLTGANCKNEVHNPLELFAVQNLVVAGETPLEGSSRPAGPKLWTNITHYSKSGTWVEVWWSNVVNPRLDDLVALYVPADADPRKTAPVKFQYAFRSPTHRTLGAGHLRFKLLNLRQDVAFMFIRGGLQFPVVTAKSNTVRNTNPNEPLQGHLSLTGKAGQVLVQWATRDTGNPVARWGTKPGHYTHAAPATSVTYTSKELCGPPATGAGWAEPGMLHAAVVSGLEPRQKYYYVFGDEEFGWSEEGSFYGPVPADHRATVRLLAVADMGQAEEDGSNEVSGMLASRNTTGRLAQEVAQGGYDLLMHNGDISYARGYATQWDTFFDQLGPVVRSLPYMTTIGNHERDWPETGDRFPTQYDSGGECGIPYYRHTRMPTRSEDEHWYSFDMGPVHFLQYSTEHEFEPGSAQYKFMKEDLKGVDRSRTPWVVVGGHRPMYVDSTFGWPPDGDQYVATQLRDSLEPLLRKYAVDVTWHGHHHSYQRTCPVLAGQCVGQNADGSAAAPVHLIIGNAGFALSPNTWPQLPEIFEVVKLEYGYLRVTANATHMQHQMVSSSTGELIDEFTLTKPAGWLLSSAAASTVPLLESQGATQGVAARA